MKEDPRTGSHASAAAAIFRRLGEDQQGGNNNDDEEETKKSANLGNGENEDKDDEDEDEDEDEDDEERAALLRWAKRAIERVESTLHDRGRRRQAPRSPAEKDVWRLVDAARADMKIFSETRAGDAYFGHRRGRVKDAIELLETRLASLFSQGQGSSSSRSNSSSSSSVYSSGPSEDDDEDEDEDEDDEDEDEEWSRYGPSATSKELFRLCRARDAKALEREFRRNPDIVRHAADTAGNTILHAAASDNWIDGVHICLSAGANIDARNLNGDTPMDLATSAVRTLLIALGAAS
ncbi:Osteoclast-stimulating factor 1 [Hondaea fermentalgiana]|uniref:Osteoclast-stimulating factor 1 n=1 Tax=Hondaea fermentalgiana TaxID=2315210 RepID=A0A2R5GK62_9STRA|nr:Osteoclast-stimulating factor 1 [Hondaea fermentalgiana]|eukprot:GBG31015.1 Osteoclast-stimulating factor 1 [Hondaea fermentalgiana]